MRYPPAKWKGDGKPGGLYTGAPWRVVWHTTETVGVPGYSGGDHAPHLTYNTANRSWTQHTDLNLAARAMGNKPGGVETNRNNALQVEIVAYSNKSIASQSPSRLWVGDLTAAHYEDLGGFCDWAETTYGIPQTCRGKNATSLADLNSQPGYRMTFTEWDGFGGHCGHGEVPEHTARYDPGVLDWDRLLGSIPEMITRDSKADDGLAVLVPSFQAMLAAGVFTDATQPGGVTFNDELAAFLIRFEKYLVDKYDLDDR